MDLGLENLSDKDSNFWVVLTILWSVVCLIFLFHKRMRLGGVMFFAAACAFMPVTVFTLGIAAGTSLARLGPTEDEEQPGPAIAVVAVLGALINGIVDTFRSPGHRQVDFMRDLPSTPAESDAIMAVINRESSTLQHITAIAVPLIFVIGAMIIGQYVRKNRVAKLRAAGLLAPVLDATPSLEISSAKSDLQNGVTAKPKPADVARPIEATGLVHGDWQSSDLINRAIPSDKYRKPAAKNGSLPSGDAKLSYEQDSTKNTDRDKVVARQRETEAVLAREIAAREAASRATALARQEAKLAAERLATTQQTLDAINRQREARRRAEAETLKARQELEVAKRREAVALEQVRAALAEAKHSGDQATYAASPAGPPQRQGGSLNVPVAAGNVKPVAPATAAMKSSPATHSLTNSQVEPVKRPAASVGSSLINSAAFKKSYGDPVRQHVQRSTIAALIDALVAAPRNSINNSEAAVILGTNKARLNGPLTLIKGYLNFEQYEVLSSGDEVRLNVGLLREHFGI